MFKRFRTGFVLICTLILIFSFCITEDKAGVVLRSFKSRRMIMEELEAEENALKDRLSFNLSNATDDLNVAVDTASSMDKINLNNSHNSNKTGSRKLNILSKSVVEYLEARGKRMEDKIFSFENTSNKTGSRKPNILTKSVVEYLGARGKRMEDKILAFENTSNKTGSRKPNILTKSVVEYLGARGKRLEDNILTFENDEKVLPVLISKNKTIESAPFRLVVEGNESVAVIDEIRENSSGEKTEDLDRKQNSEAEPEEKFAALNDPVNHALKSSDIHNKQNFENGQQSSMKNITIIVREILDTSIDELPESSFSEMSPKSPERLNESNISDESDFIDLEDNTSSNHVKNSELKIPPNNLLSDVNIEEQSKNVTVNSTKILLDGKKLKIQAKETNYNEFSTEQIVSDTEKDMFVKPLQLQESSDIIENTAQEISKIIPAFNETIAMENIEEFGVNVTGIFPNMSDEDIINLEPEDEEISQLIQNENSTLQTDNFPNTRKDNVLDTKKNNVSDTRKDNVSDTRKDNVSDTRKDNVSDTRKDNVSDTRKDNVSDTRKDNVSDTRKDNVSDTRKDNVSDTRKDNVSDTRKDNVSDTRKYNVSDTRKDNVSDTRKDNVSATRKDNVSDTRKDSFSDTRKDNFSDTRNDNASDIRKDIFPVTTLRDNFNEFEPSLESVLSSGIDFIVNSEVVKNAAMAMEVFNLSDSSLADHIIEDSDMHSFIDNIMPSVSIKEVESVPKDEELIGSNKITSNSVGVIDETQKNSTLETNSKFNASLAEDDANNSILESEIIFDENPNSTFTSKERKCPTPGLCIFWFMARDTCSDHSQCLGEKMCCRVRCSKSCIDI